MYFLAFSMIQKNTSCIRSLLARERKYMMFLEDFDFLDFVQRVAGQKSSFANRKIITTQALGGNLSFESTVVRI